MNNSRYTAFGAADSWWDDETPADQAWWVSAVRTVAGDALAKTLANAYNVGTAVAKARIEQIKQATAEELRQRAEAAGTAEAKRLAEAAEARIRKAAEEKAFEGGYKGMMVVGAVGLLAWFFLVRR